MRAGGNPERISNLFRSVTRLTRGLLYENTLTDPVTFTVTAVVLAAFRWRKRILL